MSTLHDRDKQLYTVKDLLSWEPPYYPKIIHSGVLNVKNRMLIFGDEGSWKSILALHTAHCIARGSRWLGFHTSKANVLRLQCELPMYTDRERIVKYCLGSKQIYLSNNHSEGLPTEDIEATAQSWAYPENAISRTEQFIHIDESSGWESLRRNIQNCIAELPNLPLVVILDPLYKMFNRDISAEIDVKPLIDKVDILMEDCSKVISGVSFIIVHHTRKAKTDDSGKPTHMGSQDATGARTWVRWADTVLRADPDPADGTMTRIKATFTKHRNAEDTLPTVTIKWDRDTLHPRIVSRYMPRYEDEEEIEPRGDEVIAELE